jgi:hypothetical protein
MSPEALIPPPARGIRATLRGAACLRLAADWMEQQCARLSARARRPLSGCCRQHRTLGSSHRGVERWNGSREPPTVCRQASPTGLRTTLRLICS